MSFSDEIAIAGESNLRQSCPVQIVISTERLTLIFVVQDFKQQIMED